MSKDDEYRANAAECQRMSEITKNPADKQTWLEMAAGWMRMIRQPQPSASDKFDEAEKTQGTGQARSGSEH
jgi:hypothetical protein